MLRASGCPLHGVCGGSAIPANWVTGARENPWEEELPRGTCRGQALALYMRPGPGQREPHVEFGGRAGGLGVLAGARGKSGGGITWDRSFLGSHVEPVAWHGLGDMSSGAHVKVLGGTASLGKHPAPRRYGSRVSRAGSGNNHPQGSECGQWVKPWEGPARRAQPRAPLGTCSCCIAWVLFPGVACRRAEWVFLGFAQGVCIATVLGYLFRMGSHVGLGAKCSRGVARRERL